MYFCICRRWVLHYSVHLSTPSVLLQNIFFFIWIHWENSPLTILTSTWLSLSLTGRPSYSLRFSCAVVVSLRMASTWRAGNASMQMPPADALRSSDQDIFLHSPCSSFVEKELKRADRNLVRGPHHLFVGILSRLAQSGCKAIPQWCHRFDSNNICFCSRCRQEI